MDLNELSRHVIEGDAKTAEAWTREALDQGIDPMVIVNQGLMPGMEVVGQRFKDFEYYMPEVLVSARAMKMSMALVRPLLSERPDAVVIGTVRGDLHDIGKNLVGMMLEGAGFDVIDLGTDVQPQDFVQAAEENQADIVGLSALLTTTMEAIEETIDLFDKAELRNKVKIMVGGAPITEQYAMRIGADGFAAEAASAADIAKKLIGVTA
jgi:5-methyltetrahydrofolate--homocysteine methyltransferase